MLCRAATRVWLRRLRNGPRCAAWNFAAEVSTEIAKRQLLTAFRMGDVQEARSYLDSVAFTPEHFAMSARRMWFREA